MLFSQTLSTRYPGFVKPVNITEVTITVPEVHVFGETKIQRDRLVYTEDDYFGHRNMKLFQSKRRVIPVDGQLQRQFFKQLIVTTNQDKVSSESFPKSLLGVDFYHPSNRLPESCVEKLMKAYGHRF